jgi:uncharacterized protein YcbX
MLGEELDAVDLSKDGIVGDRMFAIRDRETGKIASAKHPKLWPNLLGCRAAFVESPRGGHELPPARIELADGVSVLSDAADVDAVLSRFVERDVELAAAAQDGYTIDQYHPDEENYDPGGHRDAVVDARLGAAFFNDQGLPSAVAADSFFDLFPLSVVTTSTLDELGEREPESQFDARRFRMNVIVETRASGFVENDWAGASSIRAPASTRAPRRRGRSGGTIRCACSDPAPRPRLQLRRDTKPTQSRPARVSPPAHRSKEAHVHAVVVRVTINDMESADKALREEVVPRVSQAAGFVTGYWTRKDNTGLSMIIFESEDSAKQASERVQQSMPASVTLDGVEIREVAAHA